MAYMINAIINLPRKRKQAIMLSFDGIALICILFSSFWLRIGSFYYPSDNHELLIAIYAVPVIALPIFVSFGLYRDVVRYVSFRALWSIIKGATTYAIFWGLLIFMFRIESVPRSVVLINCVLTVIIICGSRVFARWLFLGSNGKKNVLIYGAGSAGRQLSNALKESQEYNPVAFIDDSIGLKNHLINGLKIFQPDNLQYLIKKSNSKEILLAIPTLSRARRREIIDLLEPYPIKVRSLPGVSELVDGKVKINDLLEIDLKDLLGRPSILQNNNVFDKNTYNSVVMVTGAGGSIGSELCRQILISKPKKLILYELSESSLYQIDQELSNTNEVKTEIYPIIGSVLDKQRVKSICENYGVNTIYHAAAYKHVPLVESNPSQGLLNNTIGTLMLCEAAIASKVDTFVLISTDKAVRPTNIMGASKRAAEMILQALDEVSLNTCFTMVRFGNVLDSSGSVIPLFRKQIKAGGPITVTHPDIIRYFMTISEAVELVLQAGSMAKGGEVFLLDMGEPVRIYDLAVKMIKLSGLELLDESNPKGDIEIQYTGLRPGEKLYEELLVGGTFSFTENKLIMRAEEEKMSWDQLKPLLDEISNHVKYSDNKKLNESINKIVPEFKNKLK
jgi:FlaA1/EpsC-like NDP-sugar epimerase